MSRSRFVKTFQTVFQSGCMILQSHQPWMTVLVAAHCRKLLMMAVIWISPTLICVFVVVWLLGHVQLFATPWAAVCQTSLCFTISWSLPKLMSIESMMLSNDLILCCPLLLLPSEFPSIKFFSNKLALCIRWPKYWSLNFSLSLSNEYSGLISFMINCKVWSPCSPKDSEESSPRLEFEGISSSALVLFMVQLSYLYVTTGKTIALAIQISVGKVKLLIFSTLFKFIIAFFPRTKCLLISWLQSPPTVILEPKKIKSVTATFLSSICQRVMGPDAMILVFWTLSFKPAFHSPLLPS